MRSPLFLSLLTAMALSITACSGPPTSSQVTEEAAGSQQDLARLGGSEANKELQSLYQAAINRGETEIVIYGASGTAKRPIYDRFEKTFPKLRVTAVDVLGAKMLTKLDQEFATGKRISDIASTGLTTMVTLAENDRFESYFPPNISESDIIPGCTTPGNAYLCLSMTPTGLAYNTDMVKAEEAPKGWNDLLDPRWKGKIYMFDPTTAGPGEGTLEALLYDPRYDEAWLRRLSAQDLTFVSQLSEDRLVSGQSWIEVPSVYSSFKEVQDKGAPVKFVFPLDGGNTVINNYQGVLAGAPHPNAAKLFVAWTYTPEGSRAMADIGYYSPLNEATPPEGFPKLTEVDMLKPIPLEEATTVTKNQLALNKEIFG